MLVAIELVPLQPARADDSWQKFCSDQIPSQDEWNALPFMMAFKDLPKHCLELGLKTRVGSSDLTESIPLDASNVSLQFDEPDGTAKLEEVPTVGISPIARDIYCSRTAADWKIVGAKCPLLSVYAPPDIGKALASIGWGPSIFLEHGLPYDLTLSGKLKNIYSPRTRLFAKTITLDGLTADRVELTGWLITGDLVLSNDKIGTVNLGNTIVIGQLRIVNTTAELEFNDFGAVEGIVAGAMIHGGITTDASSVIPSALCKPWPTGQSQQGPVLISTC